MMCRSMMSAHTFDGQMRTDAELTPAYSCRCMTMSYGSGQSEFLKHARQTVLIFWACLQYWSGLFRCAASRYATFA